VFNLDNGIKNGNLGIKGENIMLKNAGKLEEENFQGMELSEIVAMLNSILTAPDDRKREYLEAIIEDMENVLSEESQTLH